MSSGSRTKLACASGKYWRNWGDALREAGHEANELHGASDSQSLLRMLADLTRALNRFPTQGDLQLASARRNGFPNHSTILNRLGTKLGILRQVIRFCDETAGYDDVLALCEVEVARLPTEESAPVEESRDGLVQGFVYLIKSGRAYKIGATSDVEQRISAFNHQLPHPPQLVHQISTDDIFGIERYWHKRFESKKIRSEWFNLAAADVAAIRKRKFM